MTITRRRFLHTSAAGAGAIVASTLPLPALAQGEIMPKTGKRVIVIGGGWGGNTAAKYIRLQDPGIEVVLIEREAAFRSCPISNWVIGGLKSIGDITVSYEGLVNKHGVKLVRGTVTGIDTAAQTVTVSEGTIAYDRLILSPGITLRTSEIEGLDDAAPGTFPAAWKAGEETVMLRDQLAAMPAGGTVALSVPFGPYRCPPGPYERISLIADFLKNNKPGSKIIVLDANSKIVSKGKLFKAAWDDFYGGIIDYRPDNNVVRVDPATRTLYSDFDEVKADVANVIPAQQANSLAFQAGLVPGDRRWAPVNPWDFSSTVAENVHIVGDSTDGTTVGKVPKSGYIANSMGKVCAAAVVALMNGRDTPRPSMANTCYSLVSGEEGISVSAVYDYNDEENRILPIKGASGLSPARTPLIKQNAEDWAHSIWSDMLG
ncbi:MAG: FAD/NAD(P)-binding oxidoreductase [Alphaproteobacteria bacterium]|nr:FAD/NAD(P)-binding oxidoreductase [Alphaproteobacteria bacterium]